MTYESVSVVIPYFHDRETINAALDSVFAQSLRPSEVILISDTGEHDPKFDEICKAYTERSSCELVAICNLKNSGPGFARNLGITEASCSYIAFLDSDDRWNLNHLEKAVSSIRSDDFVAVSMQDGNRVRIWSSNTLLAMLLVNPYVTSATLLKREVFQGSSRFAETFNFAEDFYLWLSIARVYGPRSFPVVQAPCSGVHNIQRRRGLSSDSKAVLKGTCMALSKVFLEGPVSRRSKTYFAVGCLCALLRYVFKRIVK